MAFTATRYITALDFSQIDMHAFLKASMPVRFQDISPYDFEACIATVFRADGYTVEETGYSGDFGADLVLTKDGERTVVQVKRYATGTHVGVNNVNQVIGARTYYNADSAVVITTSDFTTQAIALARAADVVLWNWHRLEKYLSTIYFEGLDYDAVYPPEPLMDQEGDPVFVLKTLQLDIDVQTPQGEAIHEWHFGLRNITDRNLTIHASLPIVVSRKTQRQVSALAWKEHYFFHGVVVSSATVELACYFLKSQIDSINTSDRVVLQIHIAGADSPVIIDQAIGNPGRNCYIVTHCFGTDSTEYARMIHWRDAVLDRYSIGRLCTDGYYRVSPVLLQIAARNTFIHQVLKTLTRILIRSLLRLASLANRSY